VIDGATLRQPLITSPTNCSNTWSTTITSGHIGRWQAKLQRTSPQHTRRRGRFANGCHHHAECDAGQCRRAALEMILLAVLSASECQGDYVGLEQRLMRRILVVAQRRELGQYLARGFPVGTDERESQVAA